MEQIVTSYERALTGPNRSAGLCSPPRSALLGAACATPLSALFGGARPDIVSPAAVAFGRQDQPRARAEPASRDCARKDAIKHLKYARK